MRVKTTTDPSDKTAPIARKVTLDNGGMYAITILLHKDGLGVQSWGRTKQYDRLAQSLALGITCALNDLGTEIAETGAGKQQSAPAEAGTSLDSRLRGNDKAEE